MRLVQGQIRVKLANYAWKYGWIDEKSRRLCQNDANEQNYYWRVLIYIQIIWSIHLILNPANYSLFLIPIFILDFLCIHPFNDGNGRISRLLTLLLLYRAGYIVGKYISIEQIIEKTKESYYDVLQECSGDWHEGTNKYEPFVEYYLGVILNAYREFTNRVATLKMEIFQSLIELKKLSRVK